jgi:hypothetical protein
MKKIILVSCITFCIIAVAKINSRNSFITSPTSESWEKIEITDFEVNTKQVAEFYNGLTKFSVNITHASYKGHSTLVAHEKMSGYFKRDGKNYKSSMMGILTIQNEKAKIVIDTMGKTILVAHPDSFEPSDVITLEYIQGKKNLKSTTKKTEDKAVRYKLEYTSGKYSACEILFSNEGAINEIVFLFRESFRVNPIDENSEMASPKAIISYKDLKKNPVFDKAEFDISNYINLPVKGEPVGVKNYKEYKIVDTRYYDSSKN